MRVGLGGKCWCYSHRHRASLRAPPHSPISFAFFLYGNGRTVFERTIATLNIPKRANIIGINALRASPYPINKLRNIAIRYVTTSHFWVADMDMWPASELAM